MKIMKSRLVLYLMMLMVNLLNGQSYVLDTNYGTQGYKFNDNYLLNPKGLLKQAVSKSKDPLA